MNKKAAFFSADALIALVIIFMTLAVVYPTIRYSNYETPIQSDVTNVLSTLKIGEINKSCVNDPINGLIAKGNITDLNKTLLEQIGEFYVKDSDTAKALASCILLDLNTTENIGIWYGNICVWNSTNLTGYNNAKNVIVDRQTISGIIEGKNVTGYSASSYLSSSAQTKYFYFGGYIGEGNISMNISYTGNLTNIMMEITINNDFNVYVNDIYSGHYENSTSEFIPKKYEGNNSLDKYRSNFHSGNNILKIVGDDYNNSNIHITGGYIKITYNNDNASMYEGPSRYYFPGIEGMINLYDGFYIPGQLNNLSIFLHLNSNFSTFLTIGNVTVFNNSTLGSDARFNISDSYLSSILNYNLLSNKTIPIRLGIENISYTAGGEGKDVDVFSVNDLSGSMGDCVTYYTRCTYYCESPHNPSQHTPSNRKRCDVNSSSQCAGTICGTCSSGNNHSYSTDTSSNCYKTKLDLGKDATNSFIDLVLNKSTNRVGLVGYSTSALESNYHSLSNDNVSLINKVNSWDANGGTCICCGINKVVNKLITESTADKFRSIVIMSDGQPTYYCNSFDDFDGSGTRGDGTGATENADDIKWANDSACNAWKNYGIKVYAIGFGSDVDVSTMRAIAACGNGSYYYSDVSNLTNVYNQIAGEIIQASYNEQAIVYSGNISSILYPDSYIEFNYTKTTAIPYGLITTSEKQFSDSYYGNFSIPKDSRVLDARVVSYSGPRWTDNVLINNNSFYNLSYYGSSYVKLGDPYSINIPVSLVNISDNNINIIKVSTGVSQNNFTEGSLYNKIIYTLLRNMTSYAVNSSQIYSVAEGCIWDLEFGNSDKITMSIPKSYIGTNHCYYNSTGQAIANDQDAIEVAVLNLLKLLDVDPNDGKLDVEFPEQNLGIGYSQISGIPYGWSTEVQIRRWY
jgi:hypothetical protein